MVIISLLQPANRQSHGAARNSLPYLKIPKGIARRLGMSIPADMLWESSFPITRGRHGCVVPPAAEDVPSAAGPAPAGKNERMRSVIVAHHE
jgi:hypothetical protein